MSTATASPWQAREDASLLIAWSEGQLARVAAAFQALAVAWAADWALPTGPAARCEADSTARESGNWRALACCGERSVWLHANGIHERLARELAGSDAQLTPLAADVAAACWADCQGRVGAACGASTQGSTLAATAPSPSAWSGAVQVALPLGATLLLTPACVAFIAGVESAPAKKEAAPRAALLSSAEALADGRITLQAVLRPCEIDMGALQDLRVGDVVRLQHALSDPVALECESGRPLFTAQLARIHGNKAVALLQGMS